jgi:DNA-binding NtrC family response regulator
MPDPPYASILVVDDEYSVRDSLSSWLRKDGHEVRAAANADTALKELAGRPADIALLDIKLPGMDGMELQERIRDMAPETAVIMITAYASVETAVRALKHGAYDYVTKPVDPDEISHLVRRVIEKQHLQRENIQLREKIDELVAVDTIVGESPALRKVMELTQHVSQTDATVLIVGESGTGKELVARAIHANSQRKYGPIVAVNCGAVPESLLGSELFGHEKGAFTGADQRRRGKIEMADGGTLFLDEVGAISMKMQIELLRVLETKEYTRIGGNDPIAADFRVICATNEDLARGIEEGQFREDFYYRINVFTIEMPPLRARRSDIPLLAQHFLHRFAKQMDKHITRISDEAMTQLVDHSWPGNVRELSNAIERAMVIGRPPTIRSEDLPFTANDRSAEPGGESLVAMEKCHIADVLRRTDWNITQTARILRVDRVTVYNKIKKYGLSRDA